MPRRGLAGRAVRAIIAGMKANANGYGLGKNHQDTKAPRRRSAFAHGKFSLGVLVSWWFQFAAASFVAALPAGAAAAADGAQPAATLRIGYVGLHVERKLPHSFMEQPPQDEGVAGARVGIADDNTTGQFTGQSFALDEKVVTSEDAVAGAFKELVAAGRRFVITDLPAADLLAVADLPEARDVTLLNVSARDDELRGAACRANVLHLVPSRAMLADALVQYLVLKRWRNVLLVPGPTDADHAYAAAMERSIKKFGAKLVEEKPWTYNPGARRTDTGHYAIAAEVARFTQGLSYDVLVVADEEDEFGNDIPYRTVDPRPVAGTQGLVPTAWARPHEQWGATQLQNRFRRAAGRWMSNRDYAAWMAVRAVGEAATRTKSIDEPTLARYLRGDAFDLAAFKGVKLTFRSWDGQLRQPILLADSDSLVSVSPQQGFLHQFSELDTLGIDRPESTCKLAKQ
jgi:ABC transporter substrate binding protein (PQQ-dependent alcohol dehydrogenase system)